MPENFFRLRSLVLAHRRGFDPLLAGELINNRLQQILDSRVYWTDLVKAAILETKPPYTTGTVNLSNGSRIVVGVATDWPVADVVDTYLTADVEETGYVRLRLAKVGVAKPGMWLWIGSLTTMSGATRGAIPDTGIPDMVIPDIAQGGSGDGGVYLNGEAAPVVDLAGDLPIVKVTQSYPAGTQVRCSSLAGMQFRTGYTCPIYTVLAVPASNVLLLDMPWSGDSLTGSYYEIIHLYAQMPPDFKALLEAVDPSRAMPITVAGSRDQLTWLDPQRSSTDYTVALAEFGPDETGLMRYELWPHPRSRRQIHYLYVKRWPRLEKDTDQIPSFVDPQTLVAGAVADALRIRCSSDDPFFDERLAREYEAKFMIGLERMIALDEAKAVKTMARRDILIPPEGSGIWQDRLPPWQWWSL